MAVLAGRADRRPGTRGQLVQAQPHGVARLGHAAPFTACSDRLAVPEELVVLVVAAVAATDL
jgi:hypothetical protein